MSVLKRGAMFGKAVKRDTKLRLALSGPAGSRKTYSRLALATVSKYADLFAFGVIEPAEFNPRQLIEIIGAAVAGGYGAICIDSLSHYWMGKGGELEMLSQAAKRGQSNNFGGNGFAAWKREEKGKAARRGDERLPGEGAHGD